MNSKRVNRWQKGDYHTLTQFLLSHNVLNYDLNKNTMTGQKR